MKICCWYGLLRKALLCQGCVWAIWYAATQSFGRKYAGSYRNLSVFAQRAGIVCAEQSEQYLQDTVEYVKNEREYLWEGLEKLGIRVVSGEVDFLLLYTTQPIYDSLLAKGILIRNCENFRGLGEGYYRIAVKKHEENEVLLQELAQITAE